MSVDSLGDALPRVMARVRDVLMPTYIEIGPAGAFALTMIRADLDAVTRAMAEDDVVAMLRAYENLKRYEL
jgi:hypothetical protein